MEPEPSAKRFENKDWQGSNVTEKNHNQILLFFRSVKPKETKKGFKKNEKVFTLWFVGLFLVFLLLRTLDPLFHLKGWQPIPKIFPQGKKGYALYQLT